jgi:Tfp pilus assembly major pilin PilA
MNKKLHTDGGYTLVEVMVAMAILIIGIVALLPMLAMNVRTNVASRTYAIANYLAQEKLEKVRSWPYYEDQGGNTYGITLNNTDLFGTETGLSVRNWKVYFSRTTELIHKGAICGAGWIWGSDYGEGSFVNPNSGLTGLTLDTGNVNPCGSNSYYGEDFKMVRVTVEWDDQFGTHQIVRNMYIARF